MLLGVCFQVFDDLMAGRISGVLPRKWNKRKGRVRLVCMQVQPLVMSAPACPYLVALFEHEEGYSIARQARCNRQPRRSGANDNDMNARGGCALAVFRKQHFLCRRHQSGRSRGKVTSFPCGWQSASQGQKRASEKESYLQET